MRSPALLALAAACLAAQESHFDARSRLVLVPVTVSDTQGAPVDGLEAGDFQVFDNGQPRDIDVDTIGTGVAPIALVIAVQSSGISAPALEKVRSIAGRIQPVVTGERGCAGLLSFSERVAWLQDCTADADALERAFVGLRPGEDKAARMLDAVASAVEHLSRRRNSRRVLLLISESRDRGSETELETAALAAQSAGVTVYTAVYSALLTGFTSKIPVAIRPRQRPPNPNTTAETLGTYNAQPPNRWNPKIPPPEQRVDVLGGLGELVRLGKLNTTEALAQVTGGAVFSFTRQNTLEQVIDRLGAELHSQYVLSFAPQAGAPGYHRIEVRVRRPGLLHVRARPGYWSAEDALPAEQPQHE